MKADIWQDSSDSSSMFIAKGSHCHNPGNSGCCACYTKQIFIKNIYIKSNMEDRATFKLLQP